MNNLIFYKTVNYNIINEEGLYKTILKQSVYKK